MINIYNRNKYLAITLIIAICIGIGLSFTYAKGQEVKPNKEYITYQIKKDDTLWSISKVNMNKEYYSITAYIDEIKTINQLSNDTILAGKFLIIPIIN